MRPEDATDDFDVVIQNPAVYYAAPNDILQDARLTDAERLRLLEEWQIDISNKLAADEEGMTPPHAQHSADDARLLEEIASARAKIEATGSNGSISEAVARIWHRLTASSPA